MNEQAKKSIQEEIELLENLFEFIIPKYREAHDIIVSMLDFDGTQEIRIADLGCGFGELSRRLLEMLPTAIVFGIDNNMDILQRTRKKLKDFADRFLVYERDLNSNAWFHDLGPLDAVVSSFTLDYLELDRHKALLSEVFEMLNPQGRFVSCEFFKAVDNRVNRVFHDVEIQYIQNALKKGSVSQEQIEQLTKSTILRQDHHLCTIETKIDWLRAAGFDKIEIPWKFLNLAVVSAVK